MKFFIPIFLGFPQRKLRTRYSVLSLFTNFREKIVTIIFCIFFKRIIFLEFCN